MEQVKPDLAAVIQRSKEVILNPRGSWGTIQAERIGVKEIYIKYILILAAIPAISSFIGMTLFGIAGLYKPPFVSSLVLAIVNYVISLVILLVCAFIVQKVSEFLGAKPSLDAAFKLVAFAAIPTYVAGILNLIPVLGMLALLGALYAVYVFYLGITPLLGVPEGNRIKLCIIAGIGIIIAGFIIGMATIPFRLAAPMSDFGELNVSGIEGMENINSEELQKSAEHFKKAFEKLEQNRGE